MISWHTLFLLCRCLGVTPHIYSISRSLLQSIAAVRSGSAAVAAINY